MIMSHFSPHNIVVQTVSSTADPKDFAMNVALSVNGYFDNKVML